jgi:hypothetical protein
MKVQPNNSFERTVRHRGPRLSAAWLVAGRSTQPLGITSVAEIASWTISIVGALLISLYATWLFVVRLRRGEPKSRSFREWLKGLFEAIWGL